MDDTEREVFDIIRNFYPEDTPLRQILLKHSRQVRCKALEIMSMPENEKYGLNRDIVVKGAMLHDIGIFRCYAPDIYCTGTEPYISHGIIGAELLREYDSSLEPFARICERHTGSGLAIQDIKSRRLPLPERDFLPETPEEKLICLADKFFSKSGDMTEKSSGSIRRSMMKFGLSQLNRFDLLCRIFSIQCHAN